MVIQTGENDALLQVCPVCSVLLLLMTSFDFQKKKINVKCSLNVYSNIVCAGNG